MGPIIQLIWVQGDLKLCGVGLKCYDTGTRRSTGRSEHSCVTVGMDTNDDHAGAHISYVDSKGTSLK